MYCNSLPYLPEVLGNIIQGHEPRFRGLSGNQLSRTWTSDKEVLSRKQFQNTAGASTKANTARTGDTNGN